MWLFPLVELEVPGALNIRRWLHYKARPGIYCASCCGLVDLGFLATEFSSIWVKKEECLAMALSEDGKFRPITIFLYLNELPDNCGVSRACVTSWINALF